MTHDPTDLALDVSLETARALHRVWRALNDGDCPKCHQAVSAAQIIRVPGYIQCPNPECRFSITSTEIERIEQLFAPAMDAAVAIFERWRIDGQFPATTDATAETE